VGEVVPPELFNLSEPLAQGQGEPRADRSYDNDLAGHLVSLYKTGIIRHKGPWEFEEVEFTTREWVDRLPHRHLLEPIGQVPPAWLGHAYFRHAAAKQEEGLKQAALRWTRSGSVHEIVSNRAGKAFRTANLLVDAMCVERRGIPGPEAHHLPARSRALLYSFAAPHSSLEAFLGRHLDPAGPALCAHPDAGGHEVIEYPFGRRSLRE
jgi:hypothetical protein